MTETQIIGTMVRGRERCRQLVEFYRRIRALCAQRDPASPDAEELREADRILSAAMTVLRDLPVKPCEACDAPETREYARNLLAEIGGLLETVLIMERDLRESAAKPQPPRAALPRRALLNNYFGVPQAAGRE